MCALYVGDTATATTALAGGQTFATTYSSGPAGAWAPTITEPSAGVYTFSEVVTAAGAWVWVSTSNLSADVVSINWDVDAVVSLYDPSAVRTTSRAELRRRIADTLGDLETLTSTAAGTTTTFVDAFNVASGTAGFGGREMILTSGTYVGSIVRITGSDATTHTLTFEPALAGAPGTGVTAEVYNERSRGFRVAEYHRAINRAVANAYPIARTHITATLGTIGATGILSSPAAMEEVHTVEFQDEQGLWWPLQGSRHRGYAGWTADGFANQVTLDESLATGYAGRPARAIGYGRHPELTVDADVTTLNPDWVVYEAAAVLTVGGADRDGTRSQFAMMFRQQADEKKQLIRTRKSSGTRRVRTS